MDADLIIRGRNVVLPDAIAPASIHIADGLIINVGPYDGPTGDCDVIDVASPAVVMPGLVDTHVHVNEPGRTEWEGFYTATRAAAAGGTTTLIDMPLNSIPATTTVAAFRTKLKAAEDKCHVDVGFWGGVVPGNTNQLEGLFGAGVVGFKCFLVPSGVDEFPHVTEQDLRLAMPELTRLGALLIVHAELPHESDEVNGKDPTLYDTFLSSRPCADENKAIKLMIRLSREFGTRVHIVHLSSASSLDVVRGAKARGLPITVETCPHYLTFAAEEISDGATEYKCAPPIRSVAEREALWSALIAGEIDLVASDHSPCPPILKEPDSDFFGAWGGIASLQISLPAIWTGARARGIQPERIAEWMSVAPARLAGIANRKGAIEQGYDADITIWNPEASFILDPENLEHKHQVTPYARRELYGSVVATYVGGRRVFGIDA